MGVSLLVNCNTFSIYMQRENTWFILIMTIKNKYVIPILITAHAI